MVDVSLNKNSHNSIALSRMLRIMSIKKGEVSVPVQGNLVLPHVNGLSDGKGDAISVSRAVALNNVIGQLTKVQKTQLMQMYDDFKSGTIKRSEFVNALRDITIQNTKNKFTQFSIDTTGLLYSKYA